jgi:site-specific recombinase XerD
MDEWGWEQLRPWLDTRPALRHAHALELAREGVPLNIVQRQLGHANLGTTSIYLQGIDPEDIIATVHMRRSPLMSGSAGLRL